MPLPVDKLINSMDCGATARSRAYCYNIVQAHNVDPFQVHSFKKVILKTAATP